MMDYWTYSLCLSFDLFSYHRSQNTAQHKTVRKPWEAFCCCTFFVHADVLSSLATRPNLNSSKLNLSPLSPPRCVFISRPRNVVLLLCACVNKGCVRTLRIQAGGCRGFTVMSIKEKQNMEKGQSTAARADPTLNRLLTCLSCWIPGKHDRGTGIRFPAKGGGERGGEAGLMSSGRRLFLTFNLSGQVGDTCDSCLYCTPHIWGRENKTDCKQTETLTFFYYPVFVPNTCFVLQATPPKEQTSNNQQHSQFFFVQTVVALFSSPGISIISVLFKTIFTARRKKSWHAPLIIRTFFSPLMSPFVYCFMLKCLCLEHEYF